MQSNNNNKPKTTYPSVYAPVPPLGPMIKPLSV